MELGGGGGDFLNWKGFFGCILCCLFAVAIMQEVEREKQRE